MRVMIADREDKGGDRPPLPAPPSSVASGAAAVVAAQQAVPPEQPSPASQPENDPERRPPPAASAARAAAASSSAPERLSQPQTRTNGKQRAPPAAAVESGSRDEASDSGNVKGRDVDDNEGGDDQGDGRCLTPRTDGERRQAGDSEISRERESCLT